MAASKQSSDPSVSQPSYHHTICRVAVAQMCLTVGYSGADAAALRALADIAGRYIRLIAGTATSTANSRGRTQSNIVDLAIALEAATASRGFSGASDLTRPILSSSVLRELQMFVAIADEIPFPRPIPRRTAADAARKPTPSFAQAGREPGMTHVPRWLPCFPEGRGSGGGGACKDEEKVERQKQSPAGTGRDMMRERGRVSFKIAYGREKIGARKEKCQIMALRRTIIDEEDEEAVGLKTCRRRRDSNFDNYRGVYQELHKTAITSDASRRNSDCGDI